MNKDLSNPKPSYMPTWYRPCLRELPSYSLKFWGLSLGKQWLEAADARQMQLGFISKSKEKRFGKGSTSTLIGLWWDLRGMD